MEALFNSHPGTGKGTRGSDSSHKEEGGQKVLGPLGVSDEEHELLGFPLIHEGQHSLSAIPASVAQTALVMGRVFLAA